MNRMIRSLFIFLTALNTAVAQDSGAFTLTSGGRERNGCGDAEHQDPVHSLPYARRPSAVPKRWGLARGLLPSGNRSQGALDAALWRSALHAFRPMTRVRSRLGT